MLTMQIEIFKTFKEFERFSNVVCYVEWAIRCLRAQRALDKRSSEAATYYREVMASVKSKFNREEVEHLKALIPLLSEMSQCE